MCMHLPLTPLVLLSLENNKVQNTHADIPSQTGGADTRLIQDYLGRKNITHTVRYTKLDLADSPDCFEHENWGSWRAATLAGHVQRKVALRISGSGTVAAVSQKLGRNSIAIELVPEYVALIEERCNAVRAAPTVSAELAA
jgi:hypothetical protein